MVTYYLRMEGVNLDNFVYDTNDLNTIRGGSMILRDAVLDLPKMLPVLTPISTGASIGLFHFEAPSLTEANEIRSQTESQLQKSYPHATFVVDIKEKKSDFETDREALVALNRWRQMQSHRLAIPEHNTNEGVFACDLDLVRPGIEHTFGPDDKPIRVSTSTLDRRVYGRKSKQDFYHAETMKKITHDFAHHFDELTHCPKMGNLHHKMAVIYVDGNKFSQIQRGLDQETLSRFDDTLQGYRRQALGALLDWVQSDMGWLSANNCYRMETLLWGGDEFIWVVPAWFGWKTLSLFYEISKAWTFNDRLTHAAGVVFCHHNAPIYRITLLAKALAEEVKEANESTPTNAFAYEILESFDHVGMDLKDFRKKRLLAEESNESLILPGEKMVEAARAFSEVKNTLPHSKLYQIIDLLRTGEPSDDQTASNLIRQFDKPDSPFWQLKRLFGDNRTLLVHLAELWDYIE